MTAITNVSLILTSGLVDIGFRAKGKLAYLPEIKKISFSKQKLANKIELAWNLSFLVKFLIFFLLTLFLQF